MQQGNSNPGFLPKHVSYHQNNQGKLNDKKGRDTYIYEDNGGFNRKQMKITFQSKSGRLNNHLIQQQDQRKVLSTPLINYFSDGTGRDQYIKYNHGGLCKNQRYTADVFISTLRNNRKIENYNNDDFFLQSQFMRSKKDYFKNQDNFKTQSQLINRLIEPKKSVQNLPKLKQN